MKPNTDKNELAEQEEAWSAKGRIRANKKRLVLSVGVVLAVLTTVVLVCFCGVFDGGKASVNDDQEYPQTPYLTTTRHSQSSSSGSATKAQNNAKWSGHYLYENCRVSGYSETMNSVYFVPVCDFCGGDIARKEVVSGTKGSQRSGIAHCSDCNRTFMYKIVIE